jgi:serine protease Do
VETGSPAAVRGFKAGDVIVDVAGNAVATPADVSKAIAGARKDGKKAVLMRVKSGENTKFVALPVGDA